MLFKIYFPKNLAESMGKCLCLSIEPATSLKRRLQHRSLPVHFAKFSRARLLHNTYEPLFLFETFYENRNKYRVFLNIFLAVLPAQSTNNWSKSILKTLDPYPRILWILRNFEILFSQNTSRSLLLKIWTWIRTNPKTYPKFRSIWEKVVFLSKFSP